MSGTEAKIAAEILKPASSVISALLSPKIEKIKEWAKEKDLKGKLEPDILSKIMERYLISLANRVTETTTIAFQLKMDIFEAYEPLALTSFASLRSNSTFEAQDLIDEKLKSIIIIDNAGMGKSTFSKYVAASLLASSNRIPIFFELRKTKKEFDLIENIAREFDFPGTSFNRDLFYKLLGLGKFFVILDGFDETPLELQENLSNQIHDLSVKGGKNILMLTSRQQEITPNIIESEHLTFLPFIKEQAISLLKRYDSIAKIDIGDRLTKEIDNVPAKFIESPLLVSLLYRTYGVNNSIADKVCTFYEEIYHALYKGHDLINKNGYAREKKSNLDFEDFRKLLRALCYYTMLHRKSSFENWSEAIKFIEKCSEISSIEPSSPSNFLDDLLVSVPLMVRDGSEIKFFHKTIMEYFAAEHIVFDNSSLTLLKKLYESKISTTLNKVFEFLSEINISLFENVITKAIANSAKNINFGKSKPEQILRTLTFIRPCKIGIWGTSDYGKTMEGFDRPIFDGETPYELASASWIQANNQGKDFFIVICYHSQNHKNFHPKAWASITEPINFNQIKQDLTEKNFIKLSTFLKIETWHDLDEQLIEKIYSIKGIETLALSLIDVRNEFEEHSVLTNERIDSFLQKIEKETELAKEIDNLLQ